MHECFVKIRALVRRHAPIFASFTVEDQICHEDCAAEDGGAVEEALRETACAGRVGDGCCFLAVCAAESFVGALEESGLGGGGRLDFAEEVRALRFEGRLVESSSLELESSSLELESSSLELESSHGALLGELLDCSGQREGWTQRRCHGEDAAS